jgi:uncharacterized repeat protein (TIGR02543 family)
MNCTGATNPSSNPTSYNITSSAISLAAPSCPGYTFTGWTGSNGTTPNTTVSISSGSTGNRNYTANWSIVNYTISYTLNGGTVATANPTSYNVNTTTFTLNNPTKSYYTFTGWTGSNGSTAQTSVSVAKGSTGNKSYTANWKAVEYTISYDLNCTGATNASSNPAKYTYESNAITLAAPSCPGYTFTGWTGSNGTTAQTSVTIAKNSNGNKSYKANWSLVTYSITYDLGGGTVSPVNPTSYNVTTNEFTLNNPTKPGYTFTGWSGTGLTGTANTSVKVSKGSTGDRSYKANYSIINYTISYTLNCPTTSANSNPTSYNVTSSAISLAAPTCNGYTFKGWTGSNGSTAQTSVTIAAGSTGNKSYTATWQATSYSITYTLGCSGSTNASSNPTSYTIESNAITLAAPSCPGHTFTGWTGSNGSTAQTSVTIAKGSTGNKSYTANWTVNTYSISYTLNGGTVSPANPTSYNVNTATFTLNNPTKTYYNFTGWTGSNGSTAQTSVSVAKGSTGNKSYTANWSAIEYSIIYDLNCTNATNASSNPPKYTYESNAITLAAPTCNGYTFKGWTGSNGSTAQTSVTIAKNSSGNKSYTANWTPTSYSISYTMNCTNATNPSSNPSNYNITTATFSLAAPSCPGYTFTGWTGSNGTTANTSVSIAKGSTGNKSYTANWSLVTYSISYTLNGGTVATANPTSYNVTTNTFTLNNPTKSYYDFVGWSGTGLTGNSNKSVSVAKGSTGNRTYTANWSAIEYSITYDLNCTNATNASSNPDKYTYESNAISLAAPSCPGYTFTGWTGSNGTTAQTSVTIAKNSNGNKSYKANWSIINYSITYSLDGGSVSGNPTTYNINTATFTLVNPTKTGYNFTGWSGTGLSGSSNTTVTITKGSTGNRSYTAHWSIKTFTVTTNGSFDSSGSGIQSKTVNYGTQVSAYAPTSGLGSCSWSGFSTYSTGIERDTYICPAWDHSSPWTQTITSNTTMNFGKTSNASSYAYRYKISFYNGSSLYTTVWTNSVSSNGAAASFTFPSGPSYTGYSFNGWSTSSTATSGSAAGTSTTATGPKTYYATKQAIQYSISYTMNCTNATNPSSNPTTYYITSSAISLSAPSCPGHTFKGWTGSNGTTAQTSVTIPAGSTDNKSYTANWTTNNYTVNVVNGTFSDGTTSKSLAYGSTASIKADYTGTFDATNITGVSLGTYAYKSSGQTYWSDNSSCVYAKRDQKKYKREKRLYFNGWNDGNLNYNRTITVTGNATYTANYEYNTTLDNEYSPVLDTLTCMLGDRDSIAWSYQGAGSKYSGTITNGGVQWAGDSQNQQIRFNGYQLGSHHTGGNMISSSDVTVHLWATLPTDSFDAPTVCAKSNTKCTTSGSNTIIDKKKKVTGGTSSFYVVIDDVGQYKWCKPTGVILYDPDTGASIQEVTCGN